MINEHERVVLNNAIPKLGLEAGDVGTVVHVHRNGLAFEVEFISLDGEISLVATVFSADLRPVHKREMPHARQLAYA
ncbi:MAG: DUF4926 domain-containing protein [Lentisphaerae bacterium]|nr:DUF4926 domain-containing protein [Lentisphaerota bacterium]